jgi:hypothetical protein|nr:MAG TPA: hypothetical protein [Caudoviricetes sp.]
MAQSKTTAFAARWNYTVLCEVDIMEHFKFKCKVGFDGRLYGGGWCHESVIPNPLPPDEILFDDLSGMTEGFYTDYLWDGRKLIYSPVPTTGEPADTETETSFTRINENEEEVTYQ